MPYTYLQLPCTCRTDTVHVLYNSYISIIKILCTYRANTALNTYYQILDTCTKYLAVQHPWHHLLGTDHLVPNTWYQLLASKYLLPITCYKLLEVLVNTCCHVLATKYLVPMFGNRHLVPGPSAWYQVLGTKLEHTFYIM